MTLQDILSTRTNPKAELEAAFMAKYPNGTITFFQYGYGVTVQFTAGGKSYIYRGDGWNTRLNAKIA